MDATKLSSALGVGALAYGIVVARRAVGSTPPDPPPADPNVSFPAGVSRWLSLANEAAGAHPIPGLSRDENLRLILAVIWTESSGNPDARGPTNDYGLMQLTHPAAQDLGLTEIPLEPRANIMAGSKFLALQIRRMGGVIYDGVRAYNAGAGGARKNPNQSSGYARTILTRAGLANLIP